MAFSYWSRKSNWCEPSRRLSSRSLGTSRYKSKHAGSQPITQPVQSKQILQLINMAALARLINWKKKKRKKEKKKTLLFHPDPKSEIPPLSCTQIFCYFTFYFFWEKNSSERAIPKHSHSPKLKKISISTKFLLYMAFHVACPITWYPAFSISLCLTKTLCLSLSFSLKDSLCVLWCFFLWVQSANLFLFSRVSAGASRREGQEWFSAGSF